MMSIRNVAVKLVHAGTLLLLVIGSRATANAGRGLELTPTVVKFGNLVVGRTSAPVTVEVTNALGYVIILRSISLAGQFSYSGPSVPITLKPGQSWSGSITFKPVAAQNYTGTVKFTASHHLLLTAYLNGTGVQDSSPAPSFGQLTINPTSISFGSQNIGSSATQTIAVSNTGGFSVTISNLIASGPGLNANGLSGLILLPAETATLNVIFDPMAAGRVAGSITIISNASNSPTTIAVSATGVIAPVPRSVALSWNPSTSSVTGYNVYSGSVSGGPYAKLTAFPISVTSYSYSGVQSGRTYYFVATSVDSSNTESTYSNETSIVIP